MNNKDDIKSEQIDANAEAENFDIPISTKLDDASDSSRRKRRRKRWQSKIKEGLDPSSPRKRVGRPPKLQMKLEESGEGDRQLEMSTSEEEAECVPNGKKLIECLICGAEMSKIYELRQHMEQHAQVENYHDDKSLEVAPIYSILNPYKRVIEASVVRDFLIAEIKAKRTSQFYCILNQVDVELHISDSETDDSVEGNKGEVAKVIPRNIYRCELCRVSFDRRYKALFHQKVKHSIEEDLGIACSYCGREFIGVQLLIHHLKTRCESDEKPIGCTERFRLHLVKVNLAQFHSLARARREMKQQRLTTAAKVYACNICQKSFLRSEHLTRHKAVHLPEELKAECPVCFRKFNRKDNLRTHMKVHQIEAERDSSNNTSVLCQLCGHCFTSKSNYIVHMRRHTGEKPYTCDVCGKGFPKSTDLHSHKITHTHERNFHCTVCNKAFARSSVLSKHMRVHCGAFRCTYCDETFNRPNELATHLRVHSNFVAKKKSDE